MRVHGAAQHGVVRSQSEDDLWSAISCLHRHNPLLACRTGRMVIGRRTGCHSDVSSTACFRSVTKLSTFDNGYTLLKCQGAATRDHMLVPSSSFCDK